MDSTYAHFVRARRNMLGLSQRTLAARAGVKQPLVAAIERARRNPSESTRVALNEALALRPSLALAARKREVRGLFERAALPEPQVFGSVGRGDDDVTSDVDLIVEFTDQHDIVDLLALEHRLAELLTVDVDIVDARAASPVLTHARAEAIPL